jgi:hypothetical protein
MSKKGKETYTVRVYASVLQKLDKKRKTKILSVSDTGMIKFRYRRSGSSKFNVETLPVEKVLQFGKSGEDAWVWRVSRQQVDVFEAVSVKRTARGIECDLGDGVKTILNANADIEVMNVS